jgi:type IX secretion system PorP/SprF family membrane protein
MKKIFTLALVLVGWGSLDGNAQQLWRRTQYAINPFLVNPAVAGTKNEIPFYLSYRNQWTGFKGAPVTMLASGHMRGPQNSAFGAVLQRDDTGGAITRTGIEAVGAYHIELNNYDGFSFGLGLNANQFKIDNSKLVVTDQTDVALNGMQPESTLNIDATVGVLVYGKDYYFGFSTPNLMQSKLRISGYNPEENRNARHYQFMGFYSYNITQDIEIEPSGLIKLTNNTPVQVEVNARVVYQKMAWSSITYRAKDAVAFGFGGQYENYLLGYSIDFTTSKARVMSPFTHEIIMGYIMPGKGNKYTGGTKRKVVKLASKKKLFKIK